MIFVNNHSRIVQYTACATVESGPTGCLGLSFPICFIAVMTVQSQHIVGPLPGCATVPQPSWKVHCTEILEVGPRAPVGFLLALLLVSFRPGGAPSSPGRRHWTPGPDCFALSSSS